MSSTKMATGNSPKTNNATTEQFNIRWKNYTSVLHSTFRDLLEEERLVDVTLACDGGFIKCHRIILSACSSYFENLLNEVGSENNLIIILKDLKLWELQALIHFMYNGEVSVKQNRLAPLVRAAESLHIRGLSTEPEDKSRSGRSSFENGNGDHSDSTQKRIVRRPSLVKPEESQKLQTSAAHPGKRSSITGSGVPAKIMKTVKRVQDNSQGQSGSRPNSASGSGGSQFQRPKLIANRSNSGTEDAARSSSNLQKIQARTISNEGDDSGEVVDIREEEDFTDKYSDSAETEGEGDVGLIDETVYLDDTENNAYYEDGTEADTGPGIMGSAGMMIMDPPITYPVIDAADRAERLKKATELALSGITVRQAASHYGIPRTTLCAYMKRRGYAGKRLLPSTGSQQYLQNQASSGGGVSEAEGYNEENEFPFMGLADLLKDQPNYEMQENTC